MHKLILILSLLIYTQTNAQNNPSKIAFLEKWEHSKVYLIQIAEAMPEKAYDYAPTERQMTFKEQLIHITKNMDWLTSSYFTAEKMIPISTSANKNEVIAYLKTSFDHVKKAIEATNSDEFTEKIDFFAGAKNKLQILNLLEDHVSHHRGQLIVYLNLKNIIPPKYIGW